MFTIKLYGADGYRMNIFSAESFTILRGVDGGAEITLHQKNSAEDRRYDIGAPLAPSTEAANQPQRFEKAIIENSAGRTTEIIQLRPYPLSLPKAAA